MYVTCAGIAHGQLIVSRTEVIAEPSIVGEDCSINKHLCTKSGSSGETYFEMFSPYFIIIFCVGVFPFFSQEYPDSFSQTLVIGITVFGLHGALWQSYKGHDLRLAGSEPKYWFSFL